MALMSADSRGVLVHHLMALANETKDEVIYHYAYYMAQWESRGQDPGQQLLGLIRALAENRKFLMECERKRLANQPPSLVVFHGGMDLALDSLPIRELFQSIIRRLTRRLENWYKGRQQ